MEKKPSRNFTFRIKGTTADRLEKEAKQKEISLNTLANQIFNMHTDWHSNAGKAGFLPVRRALLVELLKRHSDKDISEIARYVAKETTKDIMLLLRKQYNTKSFLDVIETSIKASNYPYQHEVSDTMHTFIIQHDMGKKWSIYLADLYQSMIEDPDAKRGNCDLTDNTVSFSIDEKYILKQV